MESVAPADLSWRSDHAGCGLLDSEGCDLTFTRLGSSAGEADLYPVLALELSGRRVLNSYTSLRVSRDKAQTVLRLRAAHLPVPATLWLGARWSQEQVLAVCGPPPHIVKFAGGSKGEGVVLTESWRSLASLLGSLRAQRWPVLIQRFVAESAGRDTRLLVVGGRVIGAARRQAEHPEEFRSNLHLGGRARVVDPLPDQVAVAEAAAACLGLEVAGVDLLETDAGPLVLEVNGSPGYEASPHFVEGVWDYLESQGLT